MRVMFSINADEAGAGKAEELKNKIEDLCKQYELEGSVRGDSYSKGSSYTGNYALGKKKKARKVEKPENVEKKEE